jgi:hypothetical protein
LIALLHILSAMSPEDWQLLLDLIALAGPSQANFTYPALLDPNYVPPSKGGAITGVSISTTVLAFIAVCLRIYGRATQKNNRVGLDDLTIISALVRTSVLNEQICNQSADYVHESLS